MFDSNFPLLLTGAFLTALLLGLAGTRSVRSWAIRRGFLDMPDEERRIHSLPTPNVGGMAIALGSAATFMAWSFLVLPGAVYRPDLLAMVLGGLAMFLVGFWDDTRHIKATTKFALQFVIASAVYFGGVQILGVSFGRFWEGEFTGIISYIVTTIWIVGTTNAFNLIDGSDGVAAGAALFASIAMGVVFALQGDPLGALMATILVGSCLGFLYFNFPPASIFMGDSGSLFLGYTLATLGVITTQKSSTLLAVIIPVIAFGVPLLDTSIAIVRRYLRHEPIFSADRGHIHHRLSDLGHSPRAVALLIYIACAGFASLSLLLAAPGRPTVFPVFLVAAAVMIVGVQKLKVPELSELARVMGRGLQQRRVISHNVRLYSAADALRTSKDAENVLDALDLAFHGSEFSRLEVWVPESLGGALETSVGERVQRDGTGYKIHMTFERLLRPEFEVELTVPLFDGGEKIGRFSLYRSAEGPRLFTDIRLVSRGLGPVLVRALKNLPAPEKSASTTSLRGS